MQLLRPHAKDLGGGFTVRRLLPAAARQAVGPFVFFDHFGPIEARPQDNHDVRPHPHIGLATVTYLFEGAMVHRDSLGVVQRIEPGAVNWMTAGRGIVHSERTPDELRSVPRRSHGLQLWAALPEADEDGAPSFSHTAARDIPCWRGDGVQARVLVGQAFELESPVRARSPTLYLDLTLRAGASLVLPAAWAVERALYVVDGGLRLKDDAVPPQQLAVLPEGADLRATATRDTRCVVVGGTPLGRRHIWWNFVASDKLRIVDAAQAWAAQPNQRFPQVPGETEFIDLPDRPLPS
jgi:redox-sensitive bicupin YhaK (pirin superfamily)